MEWTSRGSSSQRTILSRSPGSRLSLLCSFLLSWAASVAGASGKLVESESHTPSMSTLLPTICTRSFSDVCQVYTHLITNILSRPNPALVTHRIYSTLDAHSIDEAIHRRADKLMKDTRRTCVSKNFTKAGQIHIALICR